MNNPAQVDYRFSFHPYKAPFWTYHKTSDAFLAIKTRSKVHAKNAPPKPETVLIVNYGTLVLKYYTV